MSRPSQTDTTRFSKFSALKKQFKNASLPKAYSLQTNVSDTDDTDLLAGIYKPLAEYNELLKLFVIITKICRLLIFTENIKLLAEIADLRGKYARLKQELKTIQENFDNLVEINNEFSAENEDLKRRSDLTSDENRPQSSKGNRVNKSYNNNGNVIVIDD